MNISFDSNEIDRPSESDLLYSFTINAATIEADVNNNSTYKDDSNNFDNDNVNYYLHHNEEVRSESDSSELSTVQSIEIRDRSRQSSRHRCRVQHIALKIHGQTYRNARSMFMKTQKSYNDDSSFYIDSATKLCLLK